jgi:hypothetical protein
VTGLLKWTQDISGILPPFLFQTSNTTFGNFSMMSPLLGIALIFYSYSISLIAADYSIEVLTSITQDKNPKPSLEKQRIFVSPDAIRNDLYRGQQLKRTSIMSDSGVLLCDYDQKEKASCTPMPSGDASQAKGVPKTDFKRENASKKAEGLPTYKYWTVTPLNRKGSFAGISCNYFKREYLMSSKLGPSSTETKHTEEFCVDQVKIKNKYLDLTSQIPAALAGDQSKMVQAAESKAKGFVLSSSAVVVTSNKTSASKSSPASNPLSATASSMFGNSMKDFAKISQGLQNFTTTSKISRIVKSISEKPLDKKIFSKLPIPSPA